MEDKYADQRYNDCPLQASPDVCSVGCEIEQPENICRKRCNRCCSIHCHINGVCPRVFSPTALTNIQKMVYYNWRNNESATNK